MVPGWPEGVREIAGHVRLLILNTTDGLLLPGLSGEVIQMNIRAWLLLLAVAGSISPATAQQAPPSFSFGAAGDFKFDNPFKAVAAAVKAQAPDFLIALGDLSYDTQERKWCEYWKQEVGYDPVVLIAGNHDSGENPGGNINEYVKFCPFPLATSSTGEYGKQYYFDYPPNTALARFILVVPGVTGSFLGSQFKSDYYQVGKPGYKFTASAIDDARAKGIEWIFVAMHKNYISTLTKPNEVSTDKDNSFMTMLLDKKVDVILQGHEHGYERSKQLTTVPKACPVLRPNQFNPECVSDSDDTLVKGAGTVIHVIGTGGKELRTLDKNDAEFCYFVNTNVESYGFGKFVVTPDAVSFTFQPSSGTLVDSYKISK
jgi:Calcineurin-like phosphoesterase